MRAFSSSDYGRPYLGYFCLLLLFSIAVTNQIRTVTEALGILTHGNAHVRVPFELGGDDFTVAPVQPEARSAGLRSGDRLTGIEGQAPRGYTDYYALLREARPGQRLEIQAEAPGAAQKAVSIQLRPAYPDGPTLADWLTFAIESLAIPAVCFGLGFWVAMARIRDKLAWLLLLVLLSFAEMFGTAGAGSMGFYGRNDFLQPLFAGYHVFFANLFSSALLLFGLYFPERLADRRLAWVTWLVAGLLIFKVITDSIVVSLYLRHIDMARELGNSVGSLADRISFLHLIALALFFGILIYKTSTAAGRDSRRRLLLLDSASAVSVTPIVLWLLLRSRFVFPEWIMLSIAALWFLFPLTMAYAILVHRAMDVRLVIRQGIRYLLARGGVRAVQAIVSVAVVATAASASGDGSGGAMRRIIPICAGLALIALIGAFAGRVRGWLDRRFFREAYNSEQILSELAHQVRRLVDTRSVLKTVADRISESLHVPRVALLLKNGGRFELAYAVGYADTAGAEIPEDSLTVQHLKKNRSLTIGFGDDNSWGQNAEGLERESIEKLKPELLLPLSSNDKLIGIMSLGPKQSEEPFTRTDIQLLDSVTAQTGLAIENSRLTSEIAAELAARERINRELEIAREVQQRLFPQKTPALPGIEIAGYCRPALGVGGDYYDYFALHNSDLGIAIGDVSGKGFPAALLMASLRASLRAQTMRGESDLAAIMRNVNTLAYESSAVNKYATFFYGEYSPESRVLRYVNAGHEPPLIFRGADVIGLETGGPVVGLLPCVQYEQGTLTLEPGDFLVALTDGISEAMNPSDEEWGVENLIACVRGCGAMACGELIKRAIASADIFAAGAEQHDDITLVVARIL